MNAPAEIEKAVEWGRAGWLNWLRLKAELCTQCAGVRRRPMQVNVFITREAGRLQNMMLVLPIKPTAPIPKAYATGWVHFGTFETSDQMFSGADVELHLQTKGYALVDAGEVDRRLRSGL